MVHALEEIKRILVAGGILIDLRPQADRWPVEVLSSSGSEPAGQVTDHPSSLLYDEAAAKAMAEAERLSMFRRHRQEHFRLYYTWDSPREMQEYLDEEWTDTASLEAAVWDRVRSMWTLAGAEARVGIPVLMLITRWVKIE